MAIKVPPIIAKMLLMVSRWTTLYIVVCRGYNDDDDNYTELVWEDDKELDFYDDVSYPEFQVWINA